MIDKKLNIKLLSEEIDMLEKAIQTLKLSVNKCLAIYNKADYSFEDLESFDSLTSKFSRASDLLNSFSFSEFMRMLFFSLTRQIILV